MERKNDMAETKCSCNYGVECRGCLQLENEELRLALKDRKESCIECVESRVRLAEAIGALRGLEQENEELKLALNFLGDLLAERVRKKDERIKVLTEEVNALRAIFVTPGQRGRTT